MSAPPKPSVAKTWIVFAAASLLLLAVTAIVAKNHVDASWLAGTRWFLTVLFGGLAITFLIQLVHSHYGNPYWPSMAVGGVVAVLGALAFADALHWGTSLSLGLIGASIMIARMGQKNGNGNGGGRDHD